jgi:hypothetical protein
MKTCVPDLGVSIEVPERFLALLGPVTMPLYPVTLSHLRPPPNPVILSRSEGSLVGSGQVEVGSQLDGQA